MDKTAPRPAHEPQGLHLIAGFHGCRGEPRYLSEMAPLRKACLAAVSRAGLTVLGDCFHQFEAGGVTGAVLLAESHLAIHTWPEFGAASVDLFVCNYTRDNRDHARAVLAELADRFKPESKTEREVQP